MFCNAPVPLHTLLLPVPPGVHHAVLVIISHQLARPTASLVSTFHTPGVPPVIFTCPATSNFAHGTVVHTPIFPLESMKKSPFLPPVPSPNPGGHPTHHADPL